MIVNTLLEHSSETNRIGAFYNDLKSVGGMDVNSFHAGYWVDDIYDIAYDQEYDMSGADEWRDDLDEAA